MRYYADLHIHSKYARACSPQLTPENIDLWCRIKGLGLVATGDFTHPKWFAELKEKLEPHGEGLYRLKEVYRQKDVRFTPVSETDVHFICGTEVACIYRHGEQTRRVHHCIFAPSLEVAAKISEALAKRGAKLASDGRPILGVTSKDLLQLILEVDARNVLIPAHAWTPWFAIFGSKSGYDSIAECFEELAPHIFAIETGLSSDPAMNWRVSALDYVALTSHSDAHSLPNLGREADIFEGGELSYSGIMRAIREANPKAIAAGKQISTPKLIGTVEFFPDEGRYHYDGHRACRVCLSPAESNKLKNICPKCHHELTIGVLNRVEELADAKAGRKPDGALGFTSLIELDKLIAQAQGVKGRATKAVHEQYWQLVSEGHGELPLLLDTPLAKLESLTTERVVEAIKRLRLGQIAELIPGYDGEYGTVHLFGPDERLTSPQSALF
jgi:uncharacterized protein (TIGR00375 family)